MDREEQFSVNAKSASSTHPLLNTLLFPGHTVLFPLHTILLLCHTITLPWFEEIGQTSYGIVHSIRLLSSEKVNLIRHPN